MGWKTKEQSALYNRNRYLRLKDDPAFREKKRAWYLKNAQKISEANKLKRASKPKRVLKTEAEKRAQRLAWAKANRDRIRESSKRTRERNPEKWRMYARDYYAQNLSLKVQFQRLNATAKERGYGVAMTLEDFSNIVASPCAYCGEKALRRGIDRIDNSIGYTKENAASCCKICNYMKKTLSVQEFLDHAHKISKLHERKTEE